VLNFITKGSLLLHITIKCTVHFGVIMRGGRVKKRQCTTVKLLATVPILLCDNNGQEEKTSCQLESRIVLVKEIYIQT